MPSDVNELCLIHDTAIIAGSELCLLMNEFDTSTTPVDNYSNKGVNFIAAFECKFITSVSLIEALNIS